MDSEATTPEEVAAYRIITVAGDLLPQTYKPVIFSRWLRSLRFGNEYFRLVDSDIYYDAYHRYIEHVLNQPNCFVNLAVLADDLDVVLGWSVFRGNTLDYVHVQKDYRGNGIGKSLIVAEVHFISHLTRTGLSIWSKKLPEARFNPF